MFNDILISIIQTIFYGSFIWYMIRNSEKLMHLLIFTAPFYGLGCVLFPRLSLNGFGFTLKPFLLVVLAVMFYVVKDILSTMPQAFTPLHPLLAVYSSLSKLYFSYKQICRLPDR